MKKLNVSYQIVHNIEGFGLPITVRTLHDGNVVFTDFATNIEGAFEIIKDRELSLEDNEEDKVLILDEPSGVSSKQEKDELEEDEYERDL